MTQKRVIGYRRPVFWQEWWHYVDIDDGRRRRREEGLSHERDARPAAGLNHADLASNRVAGAAAGGLVPQLSWAADDGVGTPVAPKVLRYAFEVAETSLDPAKINDLYSRTLTPHIFEGLYTYDHLARPVKIKPLTADSMPTHSRRLPRLDGAGAARHLLRRRPGVQGQAARARRAGLRLFVQALRRPGEQEPRLVGRWRPRGISA